LDLCHNMLGDCWPWRRYAFNWRLSRLLWCQRHVSSVDI